MEVDDPVAIYNIGSFCFRGLYSFAQDYDKALELWHRAAELGHSGAYHNIGRAYACGEGLERDEKKGIHYYEIAAMKGSSASRFGLGLFEGRSGNMDRALKHFMIAVKCGDNTSLEKIKELYKIELVTKDDYQRFTGVSSIFR